MKVFYILLLTLSAHVGRAEVDNSTNETEGPPVVAASLIGGPCGDATDCVGDPDSECELGICRCRGGYVPSRSLFDCLEIMHEVDDECVEDHQCTQGKLNGLSGCINGKCQCLTPQAVKVPEAEECVLVAELIGDECKGGGQCTPNLGDDALCRPTIGVGEKKCGCDESQSVPRLNGTHCLKFTNELGGPCEDIRQCRGGKPGPLSWCFEDICQCKDSIAVRIPEENKCLPKLGLGDGICFHDVQCEATLGHLGKCGETSEVCECREDGVPDREVKRCLHLVHLIGGECEEPQQCQLGAPGQYSNCVEDPSSDMKRRCACTHEAIELPGDSICHKKALEVGDQCDRVEQCTINLGNWSSCEGNICVCLPGSVESSDKTTCLVGPGNIDDPCEDANQCPENGVCDDLLSRCMCAVSFVPSLDLTTCLEIIDIIGGTCVEPRQCQFGVPGNYSDCMVDVGIRRTCGCTDEALHVPPRNTCYKKATYVGENCEVREQCRENLGSSNCDPRTHICTCEASHIPSQNNTKCLPMSGFGEECTEDVQCSHIPHSARCLPNPVGGSTCQCSPGYASPEGMQICFAMAQFIGDPCGENAFQCTTIPRTTCQVEDGLRMACHCDYAIDVVSTDRRRCLPIRDQLNQTCEVAAQCRPENSICAPPDWENTGDTRCICSDGYVASAISISSCLEIVNVLFHPCNENIQCTHHLGNLTECHSGRCDCTRRASDYNGRCYLQTPLGSHCTAHEQCYLGASNYSFCDPMDSHCRCLPDTLVVNETCWDNKSLGDVCSRDEECEVAIYGPTYCVNRQCSCRPGFKDDSKSSNKMCISGGSIILISHIMCVMIALLLSLQLIMY